jgi:hypothetical protein
MLMADPRHWILSYSGGVRSTAARQLSVDWLRSNSPSILEIHGANSSWISIALGELRGDFLLGIEGREAN